MNPNATLTSRCSLTPTGRDQRRGHRGRRRRTQAHRAGGDRRHGAVRTHLPGLGGRRGGRCDGLGLDEYGDDGAGIQTETAMAQHAQEGAELAGVAGDGDEQTFSLLVVVLVVVVVVVVEDVPIPELIQRGQRAHVLGRAALAADAVPEPIALGEARLDAVGREGPLDGGLVAAAVARVDGDVLAQLLQHDGRVLGRGVRRRPAQPVKRRLDGLQAARERADVEEVRRVDLLLVDLLLPEVVRDLGLSDAVDRQLGVRPGRCSVAVQFGPVALRYYHYYSPFFSPPKETHTRRLSYIPGWSTVEALRRIVPAFSVSSHEENLVLDLARRVPVEPDHLLVEPLPLG